MNRRGFLRLLGMSAAAAVVAPELVLDPERALWIPGQRTFFLPPAPAPRLFLAGRRGGKTDWITREALRVLELNLAFSKLVNRTYDEVFYEREYYDLYCGSQVGKTVTIRKPPRFDPGTVRVYGEPQPPDRVADALLIGGNA